MYDVVGSLLPLGLAVSLSPFPVIAIVLLLLSERARANGVSFLGGWVLAVFVATVVFTGAAKAIEPSDPSDPGPLPGLIRLALGALLVLLAVRKIRSGPKADADGEPLMPRWMSAMTSAGPTRSFTTGLLLIGASPKNLAFVAAAALTIGTGGLDAAELVGSITLYTLVASITVIVPVIGHALFATRLMGPLEALERWMLANHNSVMALLLVVFGVLIIGNGIGSF